MHHSFHDFKRIVSYGPPHDDACTCGAAPPEASRVDSLESVVIARCSLADVGRRTRSPDKAVTAWRLASLVIR